MRSKSALNLTIILEPDADPVFEPGVFRPFARDLRLLARQGHAENLGLAYFRQIKRQTAPAAADVEDLLARINRQLGGDMPLLGLLRRLQT